MEEQSLLEKLARDLADKLSSRPVEQVERPCWRCRCYQAAWIYDVDFEEIEGTPYAVFTVTHFYPRDFEDEIREWVKEVILSVNPDVEDQFIVLMERIEPPTRGQPFKARNSCYG